MTLGRNALIQQQIARVRGLLGSADGVLSDASARSAEGSTAGDAEAVVTLLITALGKTQEVIAPIMLAVQHANAAADRLDSD